MCEVVLIMFRLVSCWVSWIRIELILLVVLIISRFWFWLVLFLVICKCLKSSF